MYRLKELGDCFLITFVVDKRTSRMLIDCGSFRNGSTSVSRLRAVADDIRSKLGGASLDVVVGTHQHNDHLSGFVHCESLFRQIGVEQVWLSWLDDPQDSMARGIGKSFNNLKLALFDVRRGLRATVAGKAGRRSLGVLDDVFGFLGARPAANSPPELPAKAVEILRKLGRLKAKYLRPGKVLDMPGLPAGRVKVYVLGPPRDSDLLYRKDPRSGESYDHALVSARLAAGKFLDAVQRRSGKPSSEEVHFPFREADKKRGRALSSPALKEIIGSYRSRQEAWRTIDDDWMDQAESLALYLDRFTNNSSLVLAIELVDSGKVLLFAADAQTGNWISWPDVKWETKDASTDELLAKTVFYKVGHHGSHNSTLVRAFEKMSHPDLVALIPVDKTDPNIKKPNGWKMPARNLYKRLRERTSNRVLRMDGANPDACNPGKEPARTAWREAGIKPKQTSLYVELEFVDR
jgi:beta-lactamase superfamily II metal-dependent hydrolase